MRFLVGCFLLSVKLYGADLPPIPVAPPGTVLSEVQVLKLENASLKLQIMQTQTHMANMNQESVMAEVCKEVGYWDCQFNLRDRTVTQTPKPVPPGAQSSQPASETGSTPQKNLDKLDTKVFPKTDSPSSAAGKEKKKGKKK